MADKYLNFAALARAESPAGFSVSVRPAGSPLVVVAPHGGGIEPGTAEIAVAIAGADLSYYLFEGRKVQGNRDLHITSANFDEPQALALMRAADTVLTVHGEEGESDVVYLGGRHREVLARIRAELERHGLTVREHSDAHLQGRHPRNICNIGRRGAGVQLELSRGLRGSFFQSLTRAGRARPTPRLFEFARRVRAALP